MPMPSGGATGWKPGDSLASAEPGRTRLVRFVFSSANVRSGGSAPRAPSRPICFLPGRRGRSRGGGGRPLRRVAPRGDPPQARGLAERHRLRHRDLPGYNVRAAGLNGKAQQPGHNSRAAGSNGKGIVSIQCAFARGVKPLFPVVFYNFEAACAVSGRPSLAGLAAQLASTRRPPLILARPPFFKTLFCLLSFTTCFPWHTRQYFISGAPTRDERVVRVSPSVGVMRCAPDNVGSCSSHFLSLAAGTTSCVHGERSAIRSSDQGPSFHRGISSLRRPGTKFS